MTFSRHAGLLDVVLLAEIAQREQAIRTSQFILDSLNAEWARRHAVGPCADDCREPRAIAGTYAG